MDPRTEALLYCLLLSVIFVTSIYVLVPAHVRRLSRNEPEHIKARLRALCFATVISFMITRQVEHPYYPMEKILTRNVSFGSTIIPLLSYFALFSGPVAQLWFLPDSSLVAFGHGFWADMRNLVMAPILEEFVFRGLLGTLARPYLSDREMIFIVPLFFGVAHLNHAYLMITQDGRSVKDALLTVLFQTAYTTMFGAMMMQCLLRTGNVFTLILIHSWCNLMQFPEFKALLDPDYEILPRLAVGAFYCVGIFVYWMDLVPQVAADIFKIRF